MECIRTRNLEVRGRNEGADLATIQHAVAVEINLHALGEGYNWINFSLI